MRTKGFVINEELNTRPREPVPTCDSDSDVAEVGTVAIDTDTDISTDVSFDLALDFSSLQIQIDVEYAETEEARRKGRGKFHSFTDVSLVEVETTLKSKSECQATSKLESEPQCQGLPIRSEPEIIDISDNEEEPTNNDNDHEEESQNNDNDHEDGDNEKKVKLVTPVKDTINGVIDITNSIIDLELPGCKDGDYDSDVSNRRNIYDTASDSSVDGICEILKLWSPIKSKTPTKALTKPDTPIQTSTLKHVELVDQVSHDISGPPSGMDWSHASWRHDHYTDEYHLLGDHSNSARMSIQWPTLTLPAPLYETLYPHQRTGVQWLASLHHRRKGTGGGILGDDMGLGKTRQTLTLLGGLMRKMVITNALVVCPLSVLASWKREAQWVLNEEKRGCVGDVVIYQVESDMKKERRASVLRAALDSCSSGRPHLIITTYGLITSAPQAFLPSSSRQHWHYVILDEGHQIKNICTNKNKVCHRIARDSRTRRLMLTGTPIQNDLKELWTLFDWVTSQRLLGPKERFMRDYGQPIADGRNKDASEWTIKTAEQANQRLQHTLRPHFLQRMKHTEFKESLPNKCELVVWTHLSARQRMLYERYLVDGGRVSAVLSGATNSPLEAIAYLKKLCGHPSLVEKDHHGNVTYADPKVMMEQSAKLKILVDLIEREQQSKHKCLVFSQSTCMLDIIQRVLQVPTSRIDGSTKGPDRQRRVDAFNEDDRNEIPVMLLSTKAAGIGLTLTGADRAIIYDPSWNPAEDAQAVDRCYRIGQDKNVKVYRFIAAGTVEEKMYERQVQKDGIRRTITTNSGCATERYFSGADLRKLFELKPEGVCDLLHRLNDRKPEGGLERSGNQSFLEAHDQVVGVSSHDGVYTNTIVDVDEIHKTKTTEWEWNEKRIETPNQRESLQKSKPTAFVLGKSQVALLHRSVLENRKLLDKVDHGTNRDRRPLQSLVTLHDQNSPVALGKHNITKKQRWKSRAPIIGDVVH